MDIPGMNAVLTALLALGFAAAGEAVLRRRSTGAVGWNESFLVGAGTCAAALFPLSLLLPSWRTTVAACRSAIPFSRRNAANAAAYPPF